MILGGTERKKVVEIVTKSQETKSTTNLLSIQMNTVLGIHKTCAELSLYPFLYIPLLVPNNKEL